MRKFYKQNIFPAKTFPIYGRDTTQPLALHNFTSPIYTVHTALNSKPKQHFSRDLTLAPYSLSPNIFPRRPYWTHGVIGPTASLDPRHDVGHKTLSEVKKKRTPPTLSEVKKKRMPQTISDVKKKPVKRERAHETVN